MAFPVYPKSSLKISSDSDLGLLINNKINLRFPILIEFISTSFEEETKLIQHLQAHLDKLNINPAFPYPIFAITSFEPGQSITFTCLRSKTELPRFFLQKDGRLNLKESNLLDKIKLLQQETFNSTSLENMKIIKNYANSHRLINSLDKERSLYMDLLKRLKKSGK